MKWNEELNENLKKSLENGNNYSYIALKMNTTYKSILGQCNRLNIKSSDYKKEKDAQYCLECGVEILKDNKFCSRSCSTKYNNKIRIRRRKIHNKCKNCGKDIIGTNKKNNNFCDQKCQIEYQYTKTIKKWKNGEIDGNIGKNKNALAAPIKRYILEKYNYECAECGWNKVNQFTGKIPLQIHHIDGNYLNSSEENLILLCPSCHSLTETYGSKNKGHGRKNRHNKGD